MDFASLAAGPGPGATPPVASVEDEDVRRDLTQILARDEFREFADTRGRGLRDLLDRLLEWLLRDREQPETHLGEGGFSLPMPPAGFFLVAGGLLLVLILAYLVLSRARDRQADATGPGAATAEAVDPRERPPEAHLDDAALLARDGRYREALRCLYIATLVSLDRRHVISFDPALTNWQYIRPMPRTELRQDFSRFTRLFDYKWYGDEPTTERDYLACRALADRICAVPQREAA